MKELSKIELDESLIDTFNKAGHICVKEIQQNQNYKIKLKHSIHQSENNTSE